MRRTTRREVITAGALGAATLAAPPALAKRLLTSRAGIGPGRFLDGVASGDPAPTAMTFWARLTTDRPRSGARLVVARDPGMRHVVATRIVPTGSAINGTLKARVTKLTPHSEYYYVWHSGTDVSPVGRSRTLPDPSSLLTLNLGFSSCQDFRQGYYTPHSFAAGQEMDLYTFLGDYIYAEGRAPGPNQIRTDTISAVDTRSYRRKYALYRTDNGLRELHRQHPTVHVWDDHEVRNNYSDNLHPLDPAQRYGAYRAAFEWIPRFVFPQDRYRIYQRISLGRTADLFVLDERQYRTVDENNQPVSILGATQMQWLLQELRSSQAVWKIIANEVLIAPNDYGSGHAPTDAWGGYPADRTQLLSFLEQNGIDNVVFVSGDSHDFQVNVLASNFESFRSDPNRRPSAVEYMAGSVTSGGAARNEADVQAKNPWNRQFNGSLHGYGHMRLDPASMTMEYRFSDLTRPDGGTATFERFTQPAGSNNPSRQSLL